MSKPLRILALLGAVVIVFVVIAVLAARSGDRDALLHYKAALRAKGEKITFAELPAPASTNTMASYAAVTNAAATLRNVGLNPGLLEFRKYAGPGQAFANWRQPAPIWQPAGAVGRRATWDDLEAQYRAVGSTLGELRKALEHPSPDAGPYTNLLTTRRIDFISVRVAAQWLAGAAVNDLHQGRLEEALQNLEALAALARMERDELTLVAQLIRVAVAGLGLSVTWEALQSPGWTEPQLRRMQEAWEPIDLIAALEKGWVGERACGGQLFGLVREPGARRTSRALNLFRGGGPAASQSSVQDFFAAYVFLPAYKVTSIDADELFYLKTMQESLEPLRQLRAGRPWPHAKAGMAAAVTNITAVVNSPMRIRYFLSMVSIPSFTRAADRAVQAEGERRLTLAAIGVRRYDLRHGNSPATLELLVPEFLASVPDDVMTGKPLGYRRKERGCVLYSAGLDGKDDGGDPTPSAGPALDLWSGRDAVWPSAAEGEADSRKEAAQ